MSVAYLKRPLEYLYTHGLPAPAMKTLCWYIT